LFHAELTVQLLLLISCLSIEEHAMENKTYNSAVTAVTAAIIAALAAISLQLSKGDEF